MKRHTDLLLKSLTKTKVDATAVLAFLGTICLQMAECNENQSLQDENSRNQPWLGLTFSGTVPV